MALVKMRQGRFDNALKYLNQIKGPARETGWLKRDMGLCNLGLGDNEQAQHLLNQALASNPGDHQTLLAPGPEPYPPGAPGRGRLHL